VSRRAWAAKTSEKQTQRSLVGWMRLRGLLVVEVEMHSAVKTERGWRVVHAAPARGVPDVLAWLPWGQGVACEMKRADGKLRQTQALWMLEAAERTEMMLFVARTAGEVVDALEPLMAAWKRDDEEAFAAAVGDPDAKWRGARDAAVAWCRRVLVQEGVAGAGRTVGAAGAGRRCGVRPGARVG